MLCSFMFLPLQKVRFEQQVQEDEALLGAWRFRFYVHIKLLPNRLVVKNSAQAPFGLLISFGVCCSGNVNWTVAQCNGGYPAVKRWAVFVMTHIFTESSEQVPRCVLASEAKLALLEASGRQLIQWGFFFLWGEHGSLAGFELWLQQKGLRCELCALCVWGSVRGQFSHVLPSGDTLVLRGEFRGVKLIVKIM